MKQEKKITPEMQKCIDRCMEVHSICEQTMTHCLQQGGKHADMAMMGALMDCSDMTRMCGDMMMRQSPMAMDLAAMCAQAADRCAEMATSVGGGDPMMKKCADACREFSRTARAVAPARA
ncbi:four-helix bundle copper-binding protein [Microtetraspora sp. NBRC 16547]|uniref:four-helix bundle copper-binding protein n=1 Tax=Microtetraspora sp. NBRC 16547 TaxID=3030993 RepID=UPI0024A585DE|nr:four-helix bundle copper-binding protein [Microtetraspora sp. NBRC 16547]GLW96590.1 ferredoxin [Microtetraspora sp. NBRC 16547]